MMKKLISGLVLLAMLACLVLPAAAAEPTALPMTVAEAAGDPHVLAALDRAVERAGRDPMTDQDRTEMRRVLRRLAEPGAVLAVDGGLTTH